MKGVFAAGRQVVIAPTFDAWRDKARELLRLGVAPEEVELTGEDSPAGPSLFAALEAPAAPGRAAAIPAAAVSVPRAFVDRARIVACHRTPDRWQLLYRILWRLQTEKHLLEIEIDDDAAQFRRYEQQVRRDLHKMHAFVRFRKIEEADGDHYVAWYQPDHSILDLAAPFFAERFAVMRWSILTPDGSIRWDPVTAAATKGAGVTRDAAPLGDELEEIWKTYYKSIFNPARLNTRAMRSEMPSRYWKNLPEINVLPQMLNEAGARVQTMIDGQSKLSAASYVPAEHTLPILRQAISSCQGCELFRCATQAVFGAGPVDARLVLIGEQPGDEEDRNGQPFVGPSGRLLDKILEELGIDRSTVYVTNAVKHFKYVQRGKLRLHQSPRLSEINACRPWLLAELDALQPQIVVCLGASAAKSLLTAKFALMRDRGKVVTSAYAQQVIATLHPSAILRATDSQRAAEMREMLQSDLKLAASMIVPATAL